MWNDNAAIIMRSSRIAGADFSPPIRRMKGKIQAFSNQVSLKGETYMNTDQNTQSTIPVGVERIWM